MAQDRWGPVGGLAATRPLLTTLLIAFGLSALAVAGATAGGFEGALAELALFAIGLVALPAFAASAAPNGFWARGFLSLVLAALAALYYYAAPALPPSTPRLAGATIIIAVAGAIFFIQLKPVLGPMRRIAFIAPLAAALGMTGGAGLFAYGAQTAAGDMSIAAALALGIGLSVGFGLVSDYATLFSRGASPKPAAGVAARYASAPALFGVYSAALGFGALAFFERRTSGGFDPAWLAAGAVACAAFAALFLTASAAGLVKASEETAIAENRRRQAFRRFWRPFRRLLAPSSALAFCAVVAVIIVAILFEPGAGAPVLELALVAILSAGAGLIFFSARTAVIIFALLGVTVSAWAWIWGLALGAPAADAANCAALVLSAMLFAQLALAWRDARSPRLNARETTEAAMCDVVNRYLASAGGACLALLAIAQAGNNDLATAAMRLAFAAVAGLLIAPALMTAMSQSVRRDFA